MRLSETQVKILCQKVLLTLRSKQLINLKSGEPETLKKMEDIFIADLKIEDAINREAEQLLNQYASKMGGNIDKEKMFQMIKRQLIKDRNVII